MPEANPITRTTSSTTERPSGIFEAAKCERVDFRFRVTRDGFDVRRFLQFFKVESEELLPIGGTCRTLDAKNLDYHIHANWRFNKQEITFFVSFHAGAIPELKDEQEPYAEEFVPWIGSFFVEPTVHSDLHAEFRHSTEVRRSRVPPLKINIADDLEAQIDGVTLSFASIPGGIERAEVTQSNRHLIIELTGETRLNFLEFNLGSEVAKLSSFALRLTKETETK